MSQTWIFLMVSSLYLIDLVLSCQVTADVLFLYIRGLKVKLLLLTMIVCDGVKYGINFEMRFSFQLLNTLYKLYWKGSTKLYSVIRALPTAGSAASKGTLDVIVSIAVRGPTSLLKYRWVISLPVLRLTRLRSIMLSPTTVLIGVELVASWWDGNYVAILVVF